MWHQIVINKRKSLIVAFFIFVLFSIVGVFLGFLFGILIKATESVSAFDFSILTGVGALWFIHFCLLNSAISHPEKFFFGKNIVECEKWNNHSCQLLKNVVEEMSIAAGLPKAPKVYIMDTDVPNAFASGVSPKKASVCVTSGLLEILDRNELQGVIAHEIAHIANRDTTYLLSAGIVLTIIGCLAEIFSSCRRGSSAILALIVVLFLWLMYLLVNLSFFFISRKREYLADACAVQYTRYPAGLANALKKISGSINSDFEEGSAFQADKTSLKNLNSNPYLAVSGIIPFFCKKEGDGLFSTHPSTKNRIKILNTMSGADYAAYNEAFGTINNGKSVINNQDLKSCQTLSIVTPLVPVATDLNTTEEKAEALAQRVERRRDVVDLMWKANGYINIECSCQTKLKIPPSYKGVNMTCPHCGKVHLVE